MRITFSEARTLAVGCQELARANQLDTSLCCEICHSADGHSPIGALGPCHLTLPDGRTASVCCAGRKQLLHHYPGRG